MQTNTEVRNKNSLGNLQVWFLHCAQEGTEAQRKKVRCARGFQRVSRKIKSRCVLFKYILLRMAKDDFTCDKKKNTFGGGALVMHFTQLIL